MKLVAAKSFRAPITDIQRDGFSYTDSIFDRLDEDPSYDQVEQAIGQLAEIRVLSQWAIGDILVFVRYRAQFTPKGVWYKQGDVWPPELFEFVNQNYRLKLSQEQAEVAEFLSWTTYRYERFWLLQRGNELRLWQRNAQDWLTDDAFESYVRKLSNDLSTLLDYTSLMQYYHTSSAFPYGKRHAHISWTAHNEVSLIAGQQVAPSLRGLERLEAKREIAPALLEDYESRDMIHVSQLREEKRRLVQAMMGYLWEAPPPSCLYVVDLADQQRYVALRFTQNPAPALAQAMQTILSAVLPHIMGRPPAGIPLTLEGDSIRMLNGDTVATFENTDKGVVTTALSALVGRLRLIIPQ